MLSAKMAEDGVRPPQVRFRICCAGQRDSSRMTATDRTAHLWHEIRLVRVVKGPDGKLKLVGVVDHGLQIGDRVTVRVDVHLSAQGRPQRLPEYLLWQILVHALDTHSLGLVTPVVLPPDQLPCPFKSVAEIIAL